MKVHVLLVSLVATACAGPVSPHAVEPDAAAPAHARVDGGSRADAGTVAAAPDAGTVAAAPDAGVKPEYRTLRVALHVHSAVSHDACDGHSKDGGALADLDQSCLAELKDALCASRIDVTLLTDHPRFMNSRPFPETLLLQPERGETLLDPQGDGATGIRLPCAGRPDALLAAGFEGTHTMPLGLRHHLSDDEVHLPTELDTPVADAQALLAGVHEAGGVYFTAHSEEPTLPASLLEAVATDGMEWYNVHGNILQLFYGDLIGADVDFGDVLNALKALEPFLLGASDSHADLAYLPLLAAGFPTAGLDKWHEVLGRRYVVGALGNDVHQNVGVKPLCRDPVLALVCDALAAAFPNVLTSLLAGGPLLLADGHRIDSYARVLRWLNNRVLAPERSIPAVVDALARGRSYGVFAVLGEPGPFAFWAERGGERFEMGASLPAAGTTLQVRLPDPPLSELGASWTAEEATRAELRAVLWRTTASGREAVATYRDFGATMSFAVSAPGRYSLEVWLRPRHLAAALGSADELAAKEYRWILTNAIEIAE